MAEQLHAGSDLRLDLVVAEQRFADYSLILLLKHQAA